MMHGDLEPEPMRREGAQIISGSKIFMTPFRAVICPNAEILLMNKKDLKQAYEDLKTWALPIHKPLLNQ